MLPLLLAAALARPPLVDLMVPAEVVPVSTDDGWTLGLRHYPAPGPPLLMVHGMGVDHHHLDLTEDFSLAAWLQDRGWDTWVAVLRGDDGTVPPPGVHRWNFDMEDHAVHDAPALLAELKARTGAAKVAWVGHSMGGMILYSVLARDPASISAGVAVASPACLGTATRFYRQLRRLSRLLPHRGWLPGRAALKASLILGRHNPVAENLAHLENLDRREVRVLIDEVVTDVPAPMASELVRWFDARALPPVFVPPASLATGVPLLVLSADVDQIAPPPNVACACDSFSPCTYEEIGRSTGYSRSYGHGDVVVSRPAKEDVWPRIGAFLDGTR